MYVLLESDSLTNLDEMVLSDSPILRVVEQEVGEFSTLLDQIYAAQAMHLLTEIIGAKQFAQHHSGIVEAQSLIEVTGQ
jgi:hypothetical protein